MTAAQMVSYATSRILNSGISFDIKTTEVKIIYLGQLKSSHFFVMSLSPVDAVKCVNVKPIQKIVKCLDEIGFIDTHWTRITEENKYLYFMYIDDKKMIEIRG